MIDEPRASLATPPADVVPETRQRPLSVQDALTKAVATGQLAWVDPPKERTAEELAKLRAKRKRQRQQQRAGRRASAR